MDIPESVKKWIKALKSGFYKQGKQYLARQVPGEEWKYCCLGVACETYILEGYKLPVEIQKIADGVKVKSYGKSKEIGILPAEVSKWLKTGSSKTVTLHSPHPCSLTYANDNGITFEEIAKILEDFETSVFKG
jgi:hypothetical protein